MKVTSTLLPLGAERREQWLSLLPEDCRPEDALFWDIETTGLSRVYDSVYLIGYLYYQEGEFYLEQHLANHIADEVDLLLFFLEKLRQHRYLISFNGDTFDWPFLCERLKRMHIRTPLPEVKSLDLYRLYRPYQHFLGLPNGKLKTVERFLGIERQDVMTGGELIEVFYEYSRTDDSGLERVLLLHNYDDILHLPDLLKLRSFLKYLYHEPVIRAELAERGPSVTGAADGGVRQYLRIEPQTPPPFALRTYYSLKKEAPCVELSCDPSDGIRLGFPLIADTLRYYLPNYRDYYVLPDGRLLHKSLDHPPEGRKAGKADAFIPLSGDFILLPAGACPNDIHVFHHDEKEKTEYLNLAELKSRLEDPAFASALLRGCLPAEKL